MKILHRIGPRTFQAARVLVLGAAVGLVGCDDNAWEDLPTGGGTPGSDGAAPTVTIEQPDSGSRFAVGDSVLVAVRVDDNTGVAAIELVGFSLTGNPNLGTEERIERFAARTVTFENAGGSIRDTTITRFLLSATDVGAEPDDSVFIIAQAEDESGNSAADTVVVALGGPRISILEPAPGSNTRAGAPLRLRLSASDPGDRLQEVGLRFSQAFSGDTVLEIDPPVAVLDTVLLVNLPETAGGDSLRIEAFARSLSNDTATSATLILNVLQPVRDEQAPVVTFDVIAEPRMERRDTFTITVSAEDSTLVDHVGVTVRAEHRRGDGSELLTPLTRRADGDRGTFRFTPEDLGAPALNDSSTLRLEVTAFAVDTAGNCGAATVPGTGLSEGCITDGTPHVSANRTGARTDVLLVRGSTIRFPSAEDQVADVAIAKGRVFISNLLRNRLEVVRVGEDAVFRSVAVGSRPWGLAFNRDSSQLFVANSGGTNISVVSPSGLNEIERIQTPNVKLFDVTFESAEFENPEEEGDTISGVFPQSVQRFDYSDRPQYIGVLASGNLVYSTQPTGAAPDGTVRVLRRASDRLEIVLDYLEERPAGKMIVRNADSVFLVESSPQNLLLVCPRPRSRNPSIDGTLNEICVQGEIGKVADSLAVLGYDTDFLVNREIAEVGLSDTTFVAISGDHSTVAVGEGARRNARVMVLEDRPGDPDGPLVKSGEIRDLVGNAAERVIGLGLNADGSMGVARGNEAYYFDTTMRLQGVADTDIPSGGVDMHPNDPAVRASFVSGVEEGGLAYIDVISTLNFQRLRRIFIRDPVVGALRAVRTSAGLMVYAVTSRGVIALDVPEFQ